MFVHHKIKKFLKTETWFFYNIFLLIFTYFFSIILKNNNINLEYV